MFCQQCGKPMNPNSKFCPECGAGVATSTTPPVAVAAKGGMSAKKMILIVAGVAVAIVALIVLGSAAHFLSKEKPLSDGAQGLSSQLAAAQAEAEKQPTIAAPAPSSSASGPTSLGGVRLNTPFADVKQLVRLDNCNVDTQTKCLSEFSFGAVKTTAQWTFDTENKFVMGAVEFAPADFDQLKAYSVREYGQPTADEGGTVTWKNETATAVMYRHSKNDPAYGYFVLALNSTQR